MSSAQEHKQLGPEGHGLPEFRACHTVPPVLKAKKETQRLTDFVPQTLLQRGRARSKPGFLATSSLPPTLGPTKEPLAQRP